MAVQPSSYEISPQLGTVLKSLSVNLDAELNRYRRNRRYNSVDNADLFGDLEADSFDLEAIESAVEASLATVTAPPRPLPPPVPPNKKLSSASLPPAASPSAPPQAELAALQPAPSALTSALIKAPSPQPVLYGEDAPAPFPETSPDAVIESSTGSSAIAPSGYLASSEGLIESLSEVPPMPDPVDTVSKPRRKTVSLLAGASLGFVGLIAGLGASYLMANPLVTQRLTNGFISAEAPIEESVSTFDPPGPDLSANEFINLEIDNLSSLKMPQLTVSPTDNPATNPEVASESEQADAPLQNPTATSGLPPIEGATALNPVTPPTPAVPIETQAVVVPVGLTYYVTAPFVTQQNLDNIRASVSEAFVRRFADGNRVQIAAFDNPQAAQAYIEELKAQNIEAQIYGPTTE